MRSVTHAARRTLLSLLDGSNPVPCLLPLSRGMTSVLGENQHYTGGAAGQNVSKLDLWAQLEYWGFCAT